ncbi:MAG: AAA family ATPase [Polyangiales bacterium]
MNHADFADIYARLRTAVSTVVIGQPELVDGILVALLSSGHVLVEGAPGLGKTLVARAFAACLGCDFKRVQFTPDLMPSDITGSSLYDRNRAAFEFMPGPVFTQLLLADEINRAPAKTQSALLEAMQDHQVSVDGTSRPLPAPFVVVATQNSIESLGTYPLPEAQLDRFLLKLLVEDPSAEHERTIVRGHAQGFEPTDLSSLRPLVDPTQIVELQRVARSVRVEESVIGYIVDVVRRTREDKSLERGASPRASISLMRAAQVLAASAGRDFITPDDVKPMAKAVLRHRVALHPDAELQGVRVDDRLEDILRAVTVPRAG